MQKNKKKTITFATALKALARRSFLVFWALFLLSMTITILIIADYQSADYGSVGQAANKELFGAEQIKRYQEVFSTMKQRQNDNAAAASSTYPHIFK